MGSSICKPRTKKIVGGSSSWTSIYIEGRENPFEHRFSKKERLCLRETYKKLVDPKDIIGIVFIDITNDICPEFKKVFGVDMTPKANMMKMPKLGGHVARMAEFFDQMVTMVGGTENLAGAWQLVRKMGRLHAKIPFLEQNQSQKEDEKNFIALINDYFIIHFIPYLTGEKSEPNLDEAKQNEKKRYRFSQSYTQQFITDVWQRFFRLLTDQMTEYFELEREKCLNSANRRTLAPHQQAEEMERKKRLNAERQSELAAKPFEEPIHRQEELFEDPF